MTARKRIPPSSILAAVLGLAGFQEAWPCAQGDASPVRAYYCFVHWVSVGRADLASRQFADDAVVVAGAHCTESAPCIGTAAIREGYIMELNARSASLPLSDQRFDGRSLRTHGEVISAQQLGQGAVRLRGGHVFEFRGGRISSLRVEFDASDLVTAAYLRRREQETAIGDR
jgi:hypothetical protein